MHHEISDIFHQKGRGQLNVIVIWGSNDIGREGFTSKKVGHLNLVEEMGEANCSSTSAENTIW